VIPTKNSIKGTRTPGISQWAKPSKKHSHRLLFRGILPTGIKQKNVIKY